MLRTTNLQVLLTLILCLSLLACGGSETTVTDIEQLVGTWEAPVPSGLVSILVIQSDGTMISAGGRERLDQGLTETYSIGIDNELIQVQGPLMCGDSIGSYQGLIRSDGILRLITVDDPCSIRRRILDRSEPGNLEQYELEYSRVDNQ
jgi:hypothetical protein